MQLLTRCTLPLALVIVAFFCHSSHSKSSADDWPSQAALYNQTLNAIKNKRFTRAEKNLAKLKNHPLYPYLLQARLRQKLKRYPYKDIDSFLLTYGDTIAGRQLRQKWLTTLAQGRRWEQYLRYYNHEQANSKTACWYIEALHQQGFGELAINQTGVLWLSDTSRPKACDPPFKRWQLAGKKTDAIAWQRILLVLNKRNYSLARYLTNKSSPQLEPHARRLIKLYRRPQRLKDIEHHITTSLYDADIISYGLQRLASKDPSLATKLWLQYRRYGIIKQEQNFTIRQSIARQIIANGGEQALTWLLLHDPNAEDDYLLEWRIRLAIKDKQWRNVAHWIALLPSTLSQNPRWLYWLARAYAFIEMKEQTGLTILESLANERHYYGFLAAQNLGIAYDFNHAALASVDSLSDISTNPSILRAEAFYQLGQIIPARREWFSAISTFNQEQLITATALAHQWGWHQQAIQTTIKANHMDDLTIRFPLAYKENMMHSAQRTDLLPEWIYAVARQESAFASDAYSSAGARGLMQLKPTTAKHVANTIGLRYRKQDLFVPQKNIALGSHYLQQLLSEFEGNRILATAAYNVGPHRLNRWLNKQQQDLAYDIWIETLPFYETRQYIQNVLAFSVIYGHRMGSTIALIEAHEQLITTR